MGGDKQLPGRRNLCWAPASPKKRPAPWEDCLAMGAETPALVTSWATLVAFLDCSKPPAQDPLSKVVVRIYREAAGGKTWQTEAILWLCRGWEVPGDSAVCPLLPESHHHCPNPSLPAHKGLCSPPPTSQQKDWSQTQR